MTDFQDPYADMGSSLAKRDQESYRIKDGIGGKGILDDALIQQAGLEIFSPGQGQHLIDIIPYPIGDNDPMVLLGKMQVGQPTYICQAAVHTQVGPGNDKYICVAKTLGERCGRCDVMDQISRDPDADDDLVASLRPSKFPQCLYYIWDRNSENKGIQLFPISAWFMERDLQSRAKQPKVLGSGKIIYAHPGAGENGGRHIKFEVTGQGMNKKFVGHELIIRRQAVPKQILDQARALPPTDAFLVWPDYNELRDVTMLGINTVDTPPDRGSYEVIGGVAQSHEKTCPYGADIGINFGEYEECQICEERIYCEGLAAPKEVAPPMNEAPWEEPLPEKEVHVAPPSRLAVPHKSQKTSPQRMQPTQQSPAQPPVTRQMPVRPTPLKRGE